MTTDYPVHNETGPPAPDGTIYTNLRPGLRLDLDIRISPLTGRPVLHFPFQSFSDVHWGSKFSRAKRGCMVMRDNESDVLFVVGDMIGGIEMMRKDTQHTPPYHRQGAGLLIRKAETGLTDVTVVGGNHEIGLERHLNRPFTLFGMNVRDESSYLDPKGRLFLVEHGHKRRYEAMGFLDPEKGDKLGDALLNAAGEVDHFLQEDCHLENASVAMWSKKRFKTFINGKMGVLGHTERAIDASRYDGSISGDTHMKDFHLTPGGKLLINDGSWCDHVEDAVHDKHGNFAVRTLHRHHMDIEMEDGNRYTVLYRDIGLSHFAEDPVPVENEYTAKADHLFRLAGRMWPAKDRQGIWQKVEDQAYHVDRLCRILNVDPGHKDDNGLIVLPDGASRRAVKTLRQAETILATLEDARRDGNLPPRSPRLEEVLPLRPYLVGPELALAV